MARDVEGLQSLSQIETVSGDDAPFIDTTFTVFHRTLTPSGEAVVTGKTYAPSALDAPYEQYCYLESSGKGGLLEAKPLAIADLGKVTLETEESGLVLYAQQYCQFSL